MKIKPDFRVAVDAEALERIWQWTALAKGEFSCLAMVENDLLVHGVELFEQVCTQASTEIDQQALARFLVVHPAPERVRAWIHSHGTLNVFWSATDDACIEGLANDTFLVSIVVNKRRELRCRVDFWQPVRLTLDDVPIEVRLPRFDLQAECARQFREHVTEVQPAMIPPGLPPWLRPHGQPQPGPPLARTLADWPGIDDDEPLWGGR